MYSLFEDKTPAAMDNLQSRLHVLWSVARLWACRSWYKKVAFEASDMIVVGTAVLTGGRLCAVTGDLRGAQVHPRPAVLLSVWPPIPPGTDRQQKDQKIITSSKSLVLQCLEH